LTTLSTLATGCASASKTSPAAKAAATSAAPAKTSYPLTIDNCGQKVTFTGAPQRVLILNGTSVGEVESFIQLGLQKNILANAQHYGVSDDPDMVAQIKALPTGGLTENKNFDVPAEQVLAAKPDLVVSTWSGGFDAKQGFATRERVGGDGAGQMYLEAAAGSRCSCRVDGSLRAGPDAGPDQLCGHWPS
jgi:iron complex transport system substrate-binding protein